MDGIMTVIIQLLVSGLALGFIYALVGIEYTLIWNSAGLLNFSHDKLIMLGAYMFAGTFVLGAGFGFLPSIILTLIIAGIIGALIATGIFNPLSKMNSLIFAVMGTMVLGRIIKEACRLIWGPAPFAVPGWLSGNIKLGGVSVSKANIIIVIVSLVVLLSLQLFMKFTKTGTAMRCVAQNKKAAALMGINVKANVAITTAVSTIICGIIGILIIPLFNVSTVMSASIGLKGFSAGVIGGFGYLPGAILGGIFIGIVENLSVLVIPAVYKDAVSFILLILFLLVKPNGFLGKKA